MEPSPAPPQMPHIDGTNEDFGSWLKSLRDHAGLSQSKLAGLVGVDRSRVIAWEKGRSLPGARYLIALFVACGVRLEAAEPAPMLPIRPPETREQLVAAIGTLTAEVVALQKAAAKMADLAAESLYEADEAEA